MAELTSSSFEKVFNELKVVQENAVSREKYEQSQNEVKKLESMLVEANRRIQHGIEDLKKLKLKHEMQTIEIDVIKAEKHSLEAEKKTLEVHYNEVSLWVIIIWVTDRNCMLFLKNVSPGSNNKENLQN